MAAGTTPIFVATPKSAGVILTATANTNRDGATGTYTTLYTAGANGAFFKGFRWQCGTSNGNNTAGAVRLFIGAVLLYEAMVPATTFSAGVTPSASGEWYPPGGIVLTASDVAKCNTHIGELFSCWLVGGGDY